METPLDSKQIEQYEGIGSTYAVSKSPAWRRAGNIILDLTRHISYLEHDQEPEPVRTFESCPVIWEGPGLYLLTMTPSGIQWEPAHFNHLHVSDRIVQSRMIQPVRVELLSEDMTSIMSEA